MKKDVKRLWNEMRAAERMYWQCDTDDKPRLFLRRLAATHSYYSMLLDTLPDVDLASRPNFESILKSLCWQISGARRMKTLMEEYRGN